MKKFRSSVYILLLILLGSLVTPAHAQSNIQVISDSASLAFPDSIDFRAEFKSSASITSAVLEYGVDQLTCGTVEAKAFPDITPASDVKVEWTWEMRQSTSLAPGASVWWRWQVIDSSGAQFISPTKTILWLDAIHPWQVITGGNINLHYYNGGESFGQQLHEAAAQALVRLSQDIGVRTDSPVDIYIYADYNDLKDAILYEPSWAGGEAFPQNNIVIIGISPDRLESGMSDEAHELAHVLVGHLTFTCLGFIPQWLSEGLAVYGAGGPHADEQALFEQAKAADDLPSLRSLIGNFSEESSRAKVSYGEAYSVINFMINTYKGNKMMALLLDLRDGQTSDDALQAVYGFDTDGLEAAWRLSIGVNPPVGSSKATPVPTPTQVPTFVPVGAAPVAAVVSTPHPTPGEASATPASATQAEIPTGTAVPSAKQPGVTLSNITTVLEFGLACLVIAVILVGLAIFLIVRGQNRRGK
jgi:hypothetical protein